MEVSEYRIRELSKQGPKARDPDQRESTRSTEAKSALSCATFSLEVMATKALNICPNQSGLTHTGRPIRVGPQQSKKLRQLVRSVWVKLIRREGSLLFGLIWLKTN